MTTKPGLADQYDQIYGGAQRAAPPPAGAAPLIHIDGWPTNLQQALVFLARPGGRLLEIGCGGGEVLATLAPQFDEVVGIELSTVQATRAQQGLAHLKHCQILNVPLEDYPALAHGPFDCILWADVIEHVVDVIGAMRLIATLAKPGTQLVTVTPNVAVLPNRLRFLLGRAPTTSIRCPDEGFSRDLNQTILHDTGHLHYFTFRQVETLYRLAGFMPKRRLGLAGRLSHLRNLWPSVLSTSVCVAGDYAPHP